MGKHSRLETWTYDYIVCSVETHKNEQLPKYDYKLVTKDGDILFSSWNKRKFLSLLRELYRLLDKHVNSGHPFLTEMKRFDLVTVEGEFKIKLYLPAGNHVCLANSFLPESDWITWVNKTMGNLLVTLSDITNQLRHYK